MKLLPLVAALLAGHALGAAPVAAPVITTEAPGAIDLYKGTKKIGTAPTLDGCRALAVKQAAGTYSCRSIVTLKTALPPPPPDMQVGNPFDPRTYPDPVAGIGQELVYQTTTQPNPSDEGGFRTVCFLAEVGSFDPIVLPGQPGKSHLHNFFGNGSMTASSTAETMALGGSTCRGGTANQSSYWAPAVLDGITWVRPLSLIVYYKNGFRLPAETHFEPIPRGLKIVAGDPTAKTADQARGLWTCIDSTGTGPHSATIPPCAAGNTLWASVEFPQCWDGRNLDSPDHRSHMSGPVQLQRAPWTWSCPSTHPVALPVVTLNVQYPIRAGDDTARWKLASDTGVPGVSLHADYFALWKDEIAKAWVTGCNNARKDCFAHLLGDGRALQEFGGN